MNTPVTVWQRGDYRIVAVEDYEKGHSEDCEHKEDIVQMLVLERRFEDRMGHAAWLVVDSDDGDVGNGLELLMLDTISRNDLLPKWVREFVAQQLAGYDSIMNEKGQVS
jgi:hypothetical protein